MRMNTKIDKATSIISTIGQVPHKGALKTELVKRFGWSRLEAAKVANIALMDAPKPAQKQPENVNGYRWALANKETGEIVSYHSSRSKAREAKADNENVVDLNK